jgi:hypothetical protein
MKQTQNMKYSKIIQLQYEADTWMRTLQFMQMENSNLKSRLADIVKERLNKEILPRIESYQNHFIGEDEIISYLIFNVKNQKMLLTGKQSENWLLSEQIANNQKKIRSDVEKAEMTFCKVKSDFHNYLSEIL